MVDMLIAAPSYGSPALARWRSRTDALLLVIAVGSLPLLLVEFRREQLTDADRLFLDAVNVLVLVAFAIDYGVGLVLARDRRVGYGDIYPVTALGRLVGAVTMLVGISTFAIVTAKVAEYLVRSDSASEVEVQ